MLAWSLARERTSCALLHKLVGYRVTITGSSFSVHLLWRFASSNSASQDLHCKWETLGDALYTFTSIHHRQDAVSWNTIIAGCAPLASQHMALQIFSQMQQEGILPSKVTFVCILPVCGKMQALSEGIRLHCYVLNTDWACDTVIGTAVATMYGKCGSLNNALRMFNYMPVRDVVAWNAIITMYAQHGKGREALQFLARMQLEHATTNCVTFVSILDACAATGMASDGMVMHYLIVCNMLELNVVVATALTHMYKKCGNFSDALIMFFKMSTKSVITWNNIIAMCIEQSEGYGLGAFELFSRMLTEAFLPDKVTFISLFNAFNYLAHGQQAHTSLLVSGLELDVVVSNALVTMYGKCGDAQKSRQVFDSILVLNVVSWNVMMAAYNLCGQEVKTLQLFNKMQQGKTLPNKGTYINFLAACNRQNFLAEGRQMHAHIQNEFPIQSDLPIGTALVGMYGKCGKLQGAREVFDEFVERDVVLWSAIIAVYAQNDEGKEALVLLDRMQQEGAMPNKVTYVSILDACASLAAATEGKLVHRRICDSCLDLDVIIGTALVNMYGKCGNVEQARDMFDHMPFRTLISWNAMLSIYSMQGHGKQALTFFQSLKRGVTPSKSTFVSVLAACSHCGLAHAGRDYFRSMQTEYAISPGIDHYVCMIDLFGRTGHLDEAEQLLLDMPMQPTIAPLMAFLGGCRYQVDVKRGEQMAFQVFELDPNNPAPYVMLLNIYSAAGRVNDVEALMGKMRTKGLRKRLGFSYIEVNGKVHKFMADDQLHPQREKIYAELQSILKRLEWPGVHPQEGEEHSSLYHSEKLAVVYGIISTPAGTPLLVTKNLKICADCHCTLKLLSRLTNRTIVVRDANRFHHFRDGVCSCADYW